jgi:hypothetical protein
MCPPPSVLAQVCLFVFIFDLFFERLNLSPPVCARPGMFFFYLFFMPQASRSGAGGYGFIFLLYFFVIFQCVPPPFALPRRQSPRL